MADPRQRYRRLNGRWPHPDSPAGRHLSCRDYHGLERAQRAKNVLHALRLAHHRLPAAVEAETGEALHEALEGILPGILTALAVVAGTSLVGMSIGAFGGAFALGVGAVPGAVAGGSAGFSAGTWILEWMGLGFLAAHVGGNLRQVTLLLERGFNQAWGRGARERFSIFEPGIFYPHDRIPDFSDVSSAADKFARAVAVLVRLLLESVVVYLTGRGKLPKLIGHLKKSRLGECFAVWVEKHHLELLRNRKLNRDASAGRVEQTKVLDYAGVPEHLKRRGRNGVRAKAQKKNGSSVADVPQRQHSTNANGRGEKGEVTNSKPGASGERLAVIDRTKVPVDKVEVFADKIAVGSNEVVAVVGRNMRGVEPYAEALTVQGLPVETFSGTRISDSARREMRDLTTQYEGKIPDEVLVKTKMFAENKAWAQGVKENGLTVVDIDDPFGGGKSVFYEMEQSIFFGGVK